MNKRYKLLKSKKLSENKSLKEDKIEGKFSDMAGQIGLHTCKELEDFLEREGYAGALETLKSIMLDYLTYELDDLDFIAKDESLKESDDDDSDSNQLYRVEISPYTIVQYSDLQDRYLDNLINILGSKDAYDILSSTDYSGGDNEYHRIYNQFTKKLINIAINQYGLEAVRSRSEYADDPVIRLTGTWKKIKSFADYLEDNFSKYAINDDLWYDTIHEYHPGVKGPYLPSSGKHVYLNSSYIPAIKKVFSKAIDKFQKDHPDLWNWILKNYNEIEYEPEYNYITFYYYYNDGIDFNKDGSYEGAEGLAKFIDENNNKKNESLKEGVDKDNRNVNRHLAGIKEVPDFFMEDNDYRDYQGEIIIPDGVTSIGSSAFEDCSGITSVTIPKGVKYIGSSAFDGCSGLTSVTIPIGVTRIYEFAFKDCKGLTSVTISNSVRTIDEYAFDGCSGLTSVTLGNNVTSIGNGVFKDCRGLTSITIPDSLTSISDFAFCNCRSLTSVTIGNNVTSIGDLAFDNCNKLTSVTIGNRVNSIGSSAFGGCGELTSITYKGTRADWKDIRKGNGWRGKGSYWKVSVPESCIVHCTDGDIGLFESSKDESLKESYQNVDSMSREELMDEIDGIYEWALKGKHIDITSIIEDPEVFPNDKDDEEGYFKGVPTNKLRGILKILRKMKSGGSLTKDDQKVFLSKDGSINESATGCLGAKKGDKILDTKTGKIGEVKKEGQVDNYNLIYVDFGNGLRKINPMDDAQTKGRYQFADEDDSLNESISKSDRDIIIDAVKGEFETGHGYMEDKDEFEEMIGRRLTRSKYEELKDFYSELHDLGPEGFYEEYKDQLEFDPDFVEEYGYSEDEAYDEAVIRKSKGKYIRKTLSEDTIQKKNGKWTNRGKDGQEHGEFDTKEEADAQRKAMFARGFKG